MRSERGFTLIEMIIVLTILSFVMASLSVLFEQAMFSWKIINNQLELQHNLRFGLNQITEDIRNAKEIDENSGRDVITLIMSDKETVCYGLKIDKIADEHLYHLNGKVLYRAFNNGSQDPVVNFVEELRFSYNATSPSDAQFVEVTIIGRLPNKKSIQYQSGVELKWQSFKALTK